MAFLPTLGDYRELDLTYGFDKSIYTLLLYDF